MHEYEILEIVSLWAEDLENQRMEAEVALNAPEVTWEDLQSILGGPYPSTIEEFESMISQSENQGPSENPTNVDEESLEKFIESLDIEGQRGHTTVRTFQDLVNRILEKSENYLSSDDSDIAEDISIDAQNYETWLEHKDEIAFSYDTGATLEQSHALEEIERLELFIAQAGMKIEEMEAQIQSSSSEEEMNNWIQEMEMKNDELWQAMSSIDLNQWPKIENFDAKAMVKKIHRTQPTMESLSQIRKGMEAIVDDSKLHDYKIDWMTQTSKRWQYIKKMMQAYENYISMKKLFYKMKPTQAPAWYNEMPADKRKMWLGDEVQFYEPVEELGGTFENRLAQIINFKEHVEETHRRLDRRFTYYDNPLIDEAREKWRGW